MSHTTTVKTVQIRDVKALEQTVKDLQKSGVKCELVKNQVPRMYYQNQHGACDYVLKLQDSPYDVGFEKQSDGSFAPVFDEWAGKVASQIGAKGAIPKTDENRSKQAIGQLMQHYGKNAAINAARKRGYTVLGTKTDAQGNINIQVGV